MKKAICKAIILICSHIIILDYRNTTGRLLQPKKLNVACIRARSIVKSQYNA